MMANQGLKGSEAGTALSAVMRDMTAQMVGFLHEYRLVAQQQELAGGFHAGDASADYDDIVFHSSSI